MVPALKTQGIPLNAKNKKNETPLWTAINAGQPYSLGVLLRAGTDPREPGPDGSNPIEFCRKTNKQILLPILERAVAEKQ